MFLAELEVGYSVTPVLQEHIDSYQERERTISRPLGL